jgi:hypothetical protein
MLGNNGKNCLSSQDCALRIGLRSFNEFVGVPAFEPTAR